MPVEYRSISEDEFDELPRLGCIAFGSEPFPEDAPFDFGRAELERTRAAFVDGEMVGTGRNYSLELTVPGGAIVPAAGVSWIAVPASHRRRGVLRGIMAALDDDARARGDAVSILTASEGGIYARFGYGVATWRTNIHVDRAYGSFLVPRPDEGRFRYLERADALERFPEIYARTCALRPGMVSRPDSWWEESVFKFAPPSKPSFFVLHEAVDGTADGYLTYVISGDFVGGLNEKTLQVYDLAAVSPEVRALLWQFAFSVDLVETVAGINVAVDEPLRFLLADVRRLRVDALNDHLWLKILDIERALEARAYATSDRIVLEVRHDGGVSRVVLDGTPDGARCEPTTAEADLVLGLSELGSVYLGGVRPSQLAAAGLVEERTPGAVARADVMFASTPTPSCTTWF